ncbi:NAD dependent epimerase/dehydratase [Diaporthe sp. PMI_573]|nr:NAD dependent epimerase/dehydratase [Diaporthaceae sp. PMI_573]
MSSSSQLRRVGIYRNLPTYNKSVTGLRAIITGANGISGFNTMRALLDSPQRWEKIYALSRRSPEPDMMDMLSPEARSRITFVACDFTEDPASIAKTLQAAGVSADYVFFYSYIHKEWSAAEALVDCNVPLLSGFLESLELSGIRPSRFVLQTGGKNYGVHIGRTPVPLLESDPQPRHLRPNFYYDQEDILKSYCEKQGSSWNVIRPAAVVGSSSHAGMNCLYPFAVYAAVQARKCEPLCFGGNWEEWEHEYYHCSARMTGYLSEWVALEVGCANEAFNSQDGGPLTWQRFYDELARWYGAKGVVPPADDDSQLKTVLYGAGGKECPLGYGPPLSRKTSFTLEEWSRNEENHAIWLAIMKESNGTVKYDPFLQPGEFVIGDLAISRYGSVSLNKARRFGWTGFVDTMETIFEMYAELEKLGMLPAMQAESARPLF